MVRAFGWTLVALTMLDQLMFHGVYTHVAGQMLTQIFAHV
jgi:hypothetical protein